MTKYNLILLIALLLAVTGCRKDIEGVGDEDTIITTPIKNSTIANIDGLVADLTGAPISNASIELNGQTVVTDQYGYFRMTDKIIPNAGGMVKITKDGYFDSYKFVHPTSAGDYSHIKIILPTQSLSGTFNSSNGGTVETSDGAKVDFSANTIMNADGTAYTGGVNVYTYWYNPTADDLQRTMPGDLRARDTQGNEVQLATYGMLAVELQSPSGQSLNISEGNTATLTFPLVELADGAPDEIPLWSLDEETGIWIEEGTATKQGNTYVGEVSHFSFWNCDAPFPLVTINGIIKDTEGRLLPNTSLCMEILDAGGSSWFNTSYGWTDANGEYYGKVPKDKTILLSVKDECGNVIYEQEIGPFGADMTLEPIVVPTSGQTVITGMVADCDGNLISDGYVVFTTFPYDDWPEYTLTAVVQVDENGSFEYLGGLCSSLEATVQAFDYATATYSEEVEISLNQGEPLDMGIINLCESADEYISYLIDGVPTLQTDAQLCIIDGNAVLNGLNPGGSVASTIKINAIAVGDNTASSYTLLNSAYFVTCASDCESINWDVTTLGTSTGQYVEGTFEGEVEIDSIGTGGALVPISGSFRAQIDYIGAGGSISGMAWDDANSDGIRNNGEQPLEGIYIGIDNQFQQTDANGQYSLTGLKPGEYKLFVESNYPAGPVNDTADPAVNNDFDGWNGATVTLGEGENLENFDAGLIVNGLNSLECWAYSDFCSIDQSGYIEIEANGGVPPYVYDISEVNGQPLSTEPYYSGLLNEGTYLITVSDASGDVCVSEVNVFDSGDSTVVNLFLWIDTNEDGVLDQFMESLDIIVEYEVVDPNGNTIEAGATEVVENSINLQEVPQGDYFVRITPPDGYKVASLPNDPSPDFIASNVFPDDPPLTSGQSEVFSINSCGEYFQVAAAIVPE